MHDAQSATTAAFMYNEASAPEVAIPPAETNAPEAVIIQNEDSAPELVVSPCTYKGAGLYRDQLVPEYSQQTTAYDPPQSISPQAEVQSNLAPLEKKQRNTCGLGRLNTLILAIVAFVVVAAGVGGGVGGAMTASRSRPSSNISSGNSNVLDPLLCEKQNRTLQTLDSGLQYDYLCGNNYGDQGNNNINAYEVDNFTACVESCVKNNAQPKALKCTSVAFE